MKSDYTKRSLKVKDEAESNPLDKEHGYLGEHRKNVFKGHTPLGKIESGTSDAPSAGNIPRMKGY